MADASVELTPSPVPARADGTLGRASRPNKGWQEARHGGMTTGKMDPRASRKAAGKAPIRVLVIVDMETRRLPSLSTVPCRWISA